MRLAGLNEIHFPDAPGPNGAGRSSVRHTSACQIFASVKSTNSYIFDGIANGALCRSLSASVLSANFISYCQSRSDMLLAISNKRKCTLAFLQRKLSLEQRKWMWMWVWAWQWLRVGEIRCHYLCNANCVAGHLNHLTFDYLQRNLELETMLIY